MAIISFIKSGPDINPPKRMTQGSSGFDIEASDNVTLWPFKPEVVPTGISVQIPDGYELQIRPRSSLAGRGILIPNSPGTIDSDYRGQIGIILMWTGSGPVTINKGERIAQLILQQLPEVGWHETTKLTPTTRGADGYGSTGR